jgi:hypothetical protein
MPQAMAARPDHIEISEQTIRDRAIGISKSWADATSEAAERQLFRNDFSVGHKSAGHDLDEAMDQLLDYLPSLQNTQSGLGGDAEEA